MKRFSFFVFSFFVFQTLFSQQTWTLKQCLEYALINNIQIKQAELQAKVSNNNLLQSYLNLMPTANAVGNYNFSFGNSVDPTTYTFVNDNSQSLTMNLNSNLVLFNGAQKLNTIQRNKLDAEASKQDAANTANTTILQFTNLFLQALLNKELTAINNKQIAISEEQLNRAKSQIKAGTLAETAIYEFEAQLARDNASFTQAKYNALYSLLQLKIALQLDDKIDFDITAPSTQMPTPTVLAESSSIYNTAIYNQPAIKSAQAKIASALYSRRLAWGSLSPSLSFNFTLSDNYFNKATKIVSVIPLIREKTSFSDQLNNNLTKVAGFNLTIPILQGGSRIINIQNSKLQLQIRELELENQKNKLRQDVQLAFNNVKSSFETLNANEKSMVASQKSFAVLQKRFDAGLANTFEIQQARTNLFRAESGYLQSKYSYLLNLKVLEFYEGKPIALD